MIFRFWVVIWFVGVWCVTLGWLVVVGIGVSSGMRYRWYETCGVWVGSFVGEPVGYDFVMRAIALWM